ncbi:YhfG family protein [Pseudomonas brassicacearum]|uniref:YhfG family protein n=1 Tax=Pseudomonas brassicacearum TaxID=930166 RepID=UPI000F497561|nr:YhfG family protein [Pseudomonas brassicacearum]
MGNISLETKKAYAARTRRSNYAASLRLEGFKMTLADGEGKMPTREEVLKAFAKTRT